eukprot:491481_1
MDGEEINTQTDVLLNEMSTYEVEELQCVLNSADTQLITPLKRAKEITEITATQNDSDSIHQQQHAKRDTEDENDEYSVDDFLNAEQSLRGVQNPDTFIKKLKLCCVIFDFTVTDVQYVKAKEMKTTYLSELVESIHLLSMDGVPIIFEMIGTNLFRNLPPPVRDDFDPEEDQPNLDPSWPHLQFVYEFFYRFVMTAHAKVIRHYIDKSFLLNWIGLFNCQDPRERECKSNIASYIWTMQRCQIIYTHPNE